jgi:hypothetical protein
MRFGISPSTRTSNSAKLAEISIGEPLTRRRTGRSSGSCAETKSAPDWVSNAFYHHPLKGEPDAVRFVVGDFGGSLLLWGIAYGLVARAPMKNRAIVWVGGVGKVFIFFSMTQRFVSGGATALAFAVGVGDLVFAGLFGRFLWRTRASVAASKAPIAAART